jgi:hypothetical protein
MSEHGAATQVPTQQPATPAPHWAAAVGTTSMPAGFASGAGADGGDGAGGAATTWAGGGGASPLVAGSVEAWALTRTATVRSETSMDSP